VHAIVEAAVLTVIEAPQQTADLRFALDERNRDPVPFRQQQGRKQSRYATTDNDGARLIAHAASKAENGNT
jgi:hypothetical protein